MIEIRWSRDGQNLLIDAAIALTLAVVSVVTLTMRHHVHSGWAVLCAVLMCLGVALRRVTPVPALIIASLGGLGLSATIEFPLPCVLAAPLIAYSIGRHDRLTAALTVALAGAIGSALGPYTWTRGVAEQWRFVMLTGLIALCAAIVALAYLWGRLLRERQINELLDREIATERFVAAQRASEQEIELVGRRARAEVAQELHDVLAHSLSVIVVQAEGARALTAKRPEATAEALDVIAQTGRRSIGEVRSLVAMMRGDTESPVYGPTPLLNQIPELTATAGERVTLTTDGETPLVPESIGLTAYRVVQEALTNFLKHAGPTATAEVRLTYRPDVIELVVRDDGIGLLSKSDGKGSGVAGMRERVHAMGGSLAAAPRPGGGYEVKARLPMPSHLGKGWLSQGER